MDPTQKINIKQGQISKSVIKIQTFTVSRTEPVLTSEADKITESTGRILEKTGITQETKSIRLTQRRFIKVKYLKGFTTAI